MIRKHKISFKSGPLLAKVVNRSRFSSTNRLNQVVKTGENNDIFRCLPLNIENEKFRTEKRRTLAPNGERARTNTHIFKCAQERIEHNNDRNSNRRIAFFETRYQRDKEDVIERTLRRPCTIYESSQKEDGKEKEPGKERKITFNADVGRVEKIDVKSERTLRSPMHIAGWLTEEGKEENARCYEEEKRNLEADVGRVLRTDEKNVRLISSPIHFFDCVHEGIEKVNGRSTTETIKSLQADVGRLTSERDRLKIKTNIFEERNQQMCLKEREMKREANSLKTEILQYKTQINDLTMKSYRYRNIGNKFNEQRMKLTSIENENRSLTTQLIEKNEELTRMKQTVNELAAHEEMSIKLSNEKHQLEKEMSSIETKLEQMATKVHDTSQLKRENDMLYDSIESLKGQIQDKDEKIQKRHLEYETILRELATQQYDNRKILKIAKRSDLRFNQKRTLDDRECFNEELIRAENNEQQHISKACSWGKRAKRMRTLAERNLTENDEVSTQESCSESSDDCSVRGNRKLLKTSKKGIVLSNENKLRKSMTLRKDSNKEINIFNIQNVGSLTNKSTITNHSNNNLNEDLEPRAIEECDD